MDMRLQQSSEVTWHFQESENKDSWNPGMSHLEGTMHIIYSNLHILFMGKQKRFHGSDCDISKTLNHLQGRTIIIHSISLYWASTESTALLHTVLETQQWLRKTCPCSEPLGRANTEHVFFTSYLINTFTYMLGFRPHNYP